MSDDDFKSVKPGCNSAGSPKRKVGTEVVLFVESRWKGSELVDQLLSYFETYKISKLNLTYVNNWCV